ncbi:MAG: hypothetical protein OXQ31_24325 [Spirochaetaceae bacterium]|nr:hypothetical protein [Spirochaetaceae bacterium]
MYRELFHQRGRQVTIEEVKERMYFIQRQRRDNEFQDIRTEYNRRRRASGLNDIHDGGPFGLLNDVTSTMETKLVTPIMWFPWEIYMCLLYVEIEAYESHAQRVPELRNQVIDDFLQENEATIRALRNYRDKVLHPRTEGTEDRAIDRLFELMENSDPGGELDLVFSIQRMVDCYIRCMALGIVRSMDSELADLIEICKSGKKTRFRGQEKFGIWIERIRYIPPNTNVMTPEQFLGGLKTGSAPNLSMTAVLPLLSRLMDQRHEDALPTYQRMDGSQYSGYIRMLMRSLILMSEGWGLADAARLLKSEDPRGLSLPEIFKTVKEGAQPETMQDCQNLLALERVAQAMVYEPLRNYRSERHKRGIVPRWIEESIPKGDSFERLRAYRNVVFHVGVGSENPDKIEGEWIQHSTEFSTIGIVHSLLSFYETN